MPGKKLLVADDSLTIQKVIRLALSNEGYEIQTVSDGADAGQQIALFRPDVVLVDVSLPGRSAFEIKKDIASQPEFRSTRFILMSSAFEQVNQAEIDELGFEGRLVKPFDPAHLRQVLSEVLSRQPVGSGPIFVPAPPSPVTLNIPSRPKERADVQSPPPFPPPPASASRSPFPAEQEEQDIRQLTENTIKMSGLDQFDWKIEEKANTPVSTSRPNIPPTPSTSRESLLNDLQATEPSLRPFPNVLEPGSILTEGIADWQPSPQPGPAPTATTTGVALETDLMQSQVRESIESLLKKMLPEIAERIIREEIHKMLGEPPNH